VNEPLPRSGFAADMLPADELDGFLDQHAPPAHLPANKPDLQLHLVTFALGEERFALEVARVREVVRPNGLARVPQAPAHVRGVQSLRGHILPVLELRTRLGLRKAELTDTSRIIVCETRDRLVGLLVDAVLRVGHVSAASIAVPPAEVRSRLSEYVTGMATFDGRLSLLLDLDRLISLTAPSEAK
jgi:purine-binding chemotaxis protein CheW